VTLDCIFFLGVAFADSEPVSGDAATRKNPGDNGKKPRQALRRREDEDGMGYRENEDNPFPCSNFPYIYQRLCGWALRLCDLHRFYFFILLIRSGEWLSSSTMRRI
jgi:hypothetical protein